MIFRGKNVKTGLKKIILRIIKRCSAAFMLRALGGLRARGGASEGLPYWSCFRGSEGRASDP